VFDVLVLGGRHLPTLPGRPARVTDSHPGVSR
jgi:hypothetical protein